MKIVAIANHKGGSAKTTTTVNLAAAMGELGHRVLVIDLDPQGSTTNWLGSQLADRSILDAYLARADLSTYARKTSAPGVYLVQSSPWLVATDRAEEIAISLGIIATLEQLEPHWDRVLIDCPPSQGALATAALAVASNVIVPVETRALALTGLVSLLGTMDAIRERLNPGLKLDAIIACRVNRTKHAREVVQRMRAHYPGLVLDAVIRESTGLAEAPSFQLPITRYAPAAAGAHDYRAVTLELLERERLVDALARRPSDEAALTRPAPFRLEPSRRPRADGRPS